MEPPIEGGVFREGEHSSHACLFQDPKRRIIALILAAALAVLSGLPPLWKLHSPAAFLYMGIVLAWAFTVRRRILQRHIRHLLLCCCAFMILSFVLRICRADLFRELRTAGTFENKDVEVPTGKKVVLDLRGHTIDRTDPSGISRGSVISNAATLTVSGKPAITTQPKSVTVAAGNKTATLSVPATADRSGNKYRCIVTNASGSATSNAATLTVN